MAALCSLTNREAVLLLTSSRSWEHCNSSAAFWLPSISAPCSWGHLFVLDLIPLNFCWEHQCSQTIPSDDWGAQLCSHSVGLPWISLKLFLCCHWNLLSSSYPLVFLIFPALETVQLPLACSCWANTAALWWCRVALLQLCWEHMSHFRLHRLIGSKSQAHCSFRNGCLLEWNSVGQINVKKIPSPVFFSSYFMWSSCSKCWLDVVVPCLLMVVDVVWHIYLGGQNMLGNHESVIY